MREYYTRMHTTIIIYTGLLLVIILLVMLAQRLKLSYPIVLVLGGLLLSFIPGLPAISIDPELIFLIFLPPLLYEAAWNTSWKELWKWRRVIGSFAFLIVLLTSCVIAWVSSSIIPGFTLALGFLLGGIISPPDAVSATTVLKGLDVPKRLVSIVEGESLLNDASSLIVFRFALIAITTGTFTFQAAASGFFIVIIMGILTGLGIALVFYAIHRWLPTTSSIDTVLTFMAPYAMYITAEQFHVSGVLAVVSGGLFLSNRSHDILSHLSRMQSVNVWSAIGFVLNGVIFMLIGLELPVIVEQLGDISLYAAIRYSMIITIVVILTRIACTLGASLFTRVISKVITTADSNPGWRLPLLFGWAGMRGVVSLAAALSIPIQLNGQPFPQRNLILFITFVVILVTLVFQGLTLPVLVRWLKPQAEDYPMTEQEQDTLIRKKLARIALELMNEQHGEESDVNELLLQMKSGLENKQVFLDRFASDPDVHETIGRYRVVFQEILVAQRDLLKRMNRKSEFDEDIIRKHFFLLDMEEEKLRQHLH